MDEVAPELADEAVCITFWENVFVNVWRLPARLHHFEALRRGSAYLTSRYGKFGSFTVISPKFARLPAAGRERQEAAKLSRQLSENVLAAVRVVEGGGFGGAAIRAVLAGMNLVSGARHPTKVADSLVEAAEWLVPQLDLPATATPAALVRFVEDARARTGAEPDD